MAKKTNEIKINELKVETVTFYIMSTGPLVTNNWSEKAIKEMLGKQMQTEFKAAKEAKNPRQCFENSLYVAKEGWYGFPAVALKSAMVRAVAMIPGMSMTDARQLFYVNQDGMEDRQFKVPLGKGDDGKQITYSERIRTPLVRIHGVPELVTKMVRLAKGGTADVRFRAMFPEWAAGVSITFCTEYLNVEKVANLLYRAGQMVGIGEGRPEKKTDMGWGTFRVANQKEFDALIKRIDKPGINDKSTRKAKS